MKRREFLKLPLGWGLATTALASAGGGPGPATATATAQSEDRVVYQKDAYPSDMMKGFPPPKE